jgi:hypothetical protein
MVLLYQIIQVLRRAQLRIRGERAIGFQLAHRTVRCSVTVQRDCLRAALLPLIALRKNALAAATSRVAPEVDRPARPINGAIQVAPLASDLDVCLVDPP